MLGLLIELIINWILLWVVCKKNLSVLGILPSVKRLLNLFIGFLIAAVCCAMYYLSFTVLARNSWVFNKDFTAHAMAESAWWTLRSVLFEELIFRAALLYIAIQKLGTKTACIVSAVAFGVYHWFSQDALGNPVQMVFLFVMTGIWGFMFAMAFSVTKSLYLPIGLHFGWNLISAVVFSQGPLGNQLLSSSGGQKLGGALSVVFFLFQVFSVPLIVYGYLKWRPLKKRHPQGKIF